jgi:hypothetical protein
MSACVRAEFVLVDFAFRNGNYNFIGAFTVCAQYAVKTQRQKITGKVTGAWRGLPPRILEGEQTHGLLVYRTVL